MMDDQAIDTAAATDQPETLDEALGNGELIDEIESSLGSAETTVAPLELGDLTGNPTLGSSTVRDLDLLSDVDVEVSVEFGRVGIPVRQLLQLRRGSLVELARRPEQQVTVLANGKPIALGDIVVVDDQVGVHIVELIDPDAPVDPVPPPRQVELVDDEIDAAFGAADAEGAAGADPAPAEAQPEAGA
jgi:flagellar motor switch protein FliN/FliY